MEDLTYEKLQSSVKLLIENYDIELLDLSEYKNLYDAYKIIHDINQTDSKLLSSILINQHRPSDIHIGTLGSFLFGCLQDYYGETIKECSPLCIGNINSFNNECEQQVWIQLKNNNIEHLNNSKNEYAYMYVSSYNPTFESNDLITLKNNNIKYIQLVYTKNSKHEFINKLISLNELPMKNSTVITTIKNELSNYKYDQIPWLYVAIFFLILIIFNFIYHR